MRYATFIGGSWDAQHELLNQPRRFVDKRKPDGSIERYVRFVPIGRFEGLMALRSCEQVTYVLETMTRQDLVDAIQRRAQPLFVDETALT